MKVVQKGDRLTIEVQSQSSNTFALSAQVARIRRSPTYTKNYLG
ncbi:MULTISPECIES: hypothetical protein [Nostocales]|uniref:Uncharacterized protein n=2 Tax=Nostocales TaxID=1161 RepID=A0ABW8WRL9_9CYAN|nr:hypothetical protein [Tolypothrix bouteillei]